jgi:hypothetical protein
MWDGISNSGQHPFAIFLRGDYSPSSFPAVAYYCSKLFPDIDFGSLAASMISKSLQEIAGETPVRNDEVILTPVAVAARAMRYLRAKYLQKAGEIVKDPSSRKVFSSDEFYDREAHGIKRFDRAPVHMI